MTDKWKALREAEAKATKGPWIANERSQYVTGANDFYVAATYPDYGKYRNATFIALSRNSTPAFSPRTTGRKAPSRELRAATVSLSNSPVKPSRRLRNE